jgi:hypothetical protein
MSRAPKSSAKWEPTDGGVTDPLPSLFDDLVPVHAPVQETKETPDQRRHVRQAHQAHLGLHPLSTKDRPLGLHPEAIRGFAQESKADFTCGTCLFRRQVGKGMRCTAHNEVYAGSSTTMTCFEQWPACPEYRKFG